MVAIFSVVIVGLFATGWTPARAAAPGYALNDVNIRSGPGTRYRVKITVPRKSRITIRKCNRNWCRISWGRFGGWASRRHIACSSRYRPPRHIYNPPLYRPLDRELLYDDGIDRGPPILYDPRPRRPRIVRPKKDRPLFRLRRQQGPRLGAPGVTYPPYTGGTIEIPGLH